MGKQRKTMKYREDEATTWRKRQNSEDRIDWA